MSRQTSSVGGPASSGLLSLRALDRATLARQHLLERVAMPATEMVEHLVGLQAQTPQTWYVGLWNRLTDFQASEVCELME